MSNASTLTNAALTAEVSRLAACEREATAALIAHLAEFDARRLYEPAGYSSLFKYCRDVLRLSEDAVYNRIDAARVVRRYPGAVPMLERGDLRPTTLRMLGPHPTSENRRELLAAAGKAMKAVEQMLADRFPKPDVRSSVRKLPSRPAEAPAALDGLGLVTVPVASASTVAAETPAPAAVAIPAVTSVAQGATPVTASAIASAAALSDGTVATSPGSIGAGSTTSEVLASVPPARSVAVRPLGRDRYKVTFMASGRMRDKLRYAQDLLGHAVPSGDLAEVFDRALTLLVADLERKKFAATTKPRPASGKPQPGKEGAEGPAGTRAEVKRRVWARDRGRCAFVARSGHRCDERRFIEFHHVVPDAIGGPFTVDNIQLRCRAHNGHEVDLFFGPGKRHVGSTAAGVAVSSIETRGGQRTRSETSQSAELARFAATTAIPPLPTP